MIYVVVMILMAFVSAGISSSRAADIQALPTIDMTQLLMVDGKPIKDSLNRSSEEEKSDPNCAKCANLTLGHALSAALRISTLADPKFQPGPGHQLLVNTGIEKALLEHLAESIAEDKTAHLTENQVAEIKEALNYAPFSGALMLAIVPKIDPNGWKAALDADAKK